MPLKRGNGDKNEKIYKVLKNYDQYNCTVSSSIGVDFCSAKGIGIFYAICNRLDYGIGCKSVGEIYGKKIKDSS